MKTTQATAGAKLASLMGLNAGQIALLPAVVERMALSVGYSDGRFMAECMTNTKLREYVRQTIDKTLDSDIGREYAEGFAKSL